MNGLDNLVKKQQDQIAKSNHSMENNYDDVTQLVGFMLGHEEYAVHILGIQEIIKPIEFTRVPGTPAHILGVFNLRGSVIPLIDLRQKFGLPAVRRTDETRYIVMKNSHNEAGFLIDSLTEAIRLKKADIALPPETLQGGDSKMIDGIGKQEDGIVTILNIDELLKRDF